MNSNGTLAPFEGYETDVLADKATAFVERSAGGAQPFFMYLAPKNPHEAQYPAPRHRDLFPGVAAPRTPSFNEADVSDKPAYIRNLAPLTAGQIADIDALYRERLQQMMAVEDMLERLFATLLASGELENTYIFFGSDNGSFLGQHRIQNSKWSPYEEASRVPLIVRGPGVPAGRTLEHMVLNNDYAPTVADLAGVSAPDFVDGRSLVPLLTGTPPPPVSWRSAFLEEGRHGLSNQYRAVRTEDYVYVENGAENNAGERELYDLRADPYQLENEFATADPALVARLQERLGALRDCAAAACHAAEVNVPSGHEAPSVDPADASDTGASSQNRQPDR
jgi:arylsulfatase A-like enzyme